MEKQNSLLGWIVSGVGIKTYDNYSSPLNQDDWGNSLDNLANIDGHFVVVKWDINTISIQSDQLGMRDLYISKNESEIVFSTRIDFLLKVHKPSLDFASFGSRWLLFNQITTESVFKGMTRIVSGKHAVISLRTFDIQISESNWLPINTDELMSFEQFSKKLKSLIFYRNNLTLGLSGGLDSRVILSYLLQSSKSFDAFTFGEPNHPDSVVAKHIVKKYNLDHQFINAKPPIIDKIISKMLCYSTQTIVNNAASEIFQTMNYLSLDQKNLVDGGFGEIWRREFFYRLYFKEGFDKKQKHS